MKRRALDSRIEVLDLAGGEVDDVFSDVGRSVTDAFQVVRREEEARTTLYVALIGLHERDALIKGLAVERINLVIADRNFTGPHGVGVDQCEEDAVELRRCEFADLWEVKVPLKGRLWGELLRHLRHRRGVIGDALELIGDMVHREKVSQVARNWALCCDRGGDYADDLMLHGIENVELPFHIDTVAIDYNLFINSKFISISKVLVYF